MQLHWSTGFVVHSRTEHVATVQTVLQIQASHHWLYQHPSCRNANVQLQKNTRWSQDLMPEIGEPTKLQNCQINVILTKLPVQFDKPL